MEAQKKNSLDFPILLSWALSIFGLLISLAMLFTSILGGIVMIIASLLIMPAVRTMYLSKFKLRLRYAYITSTILMIVGMFYAISSIEPPVSNFQTDVTRKQPTLSTFTSMSPELKIGYECANAVQKITINNKGLDKNSLENICQNTYSYKIENGENRVTIKLEGRGEVKEETIIVNFDLEKYNQEQKEIAKRKADEEATKKAEQEAKARREQIEKWRTEGEALSGISPQEIKNEYEKQKSLSSAKGKLYLEKLIGEPVTYAGQVSNVNTEFLGEGYYISIKVEGASVYIDDPAGEYVKKINNGAVIKVKGRISSVTSFLGLLINIEGARIEIVEK